jgi:hypothetical protein
LDDLQFLAGWCWAKERNRVDETGLNDAAPVDALFAPEIALNVVTRYFG